MNKWLRAALLSLTTGGALFMAQIEGQTALQSHGAPIPFEAVIQVGNEVAISYRLQNTRPKPIYLLNVLWEFNKQGDYVKAALPAYVCLKGGRAVHVAQQLLPLPKGKRTELRFVPFVTKVDPGQQYSGGFRLSLPLREYNPYFEVKPETKFEPVTAEAIGFTLQFVNDDPGVTVKPSMIGEGLFLHHPNIAGAVETLRSAPYRGKIPFEKRTDPIDEF
jgi:hypothetical protein